MARGDWNVVEEQTTSSAYKFGFEWRYANTSAEAQTTNKDIIEVRIFASKSTGSGVYNLSDLTSYIEYTIDTNATKLDFKADYDFRNTSNTKFYLGSSLPFRRISGSGVNNESGTTIFNIEVQHNENGSAPYFKLKAYWYANNSYLGNTTAEEEIALDTILRGSKLGTIDTFNINDTLTIPISKYVSTYTDKLLVKVGETTIKTINAISNNYSLTFTATEKTAIKNLMTSPQIIVTFELQTYNGSTLIGTSIQNAICTDLDQPIMFTFHKTATGYQIGINGIVDTSKEDGLQIFGKLYINGEEKQL